MASGSLNQVLRFRCLLSYALATALALRDLISLILFENGHRSNKASQEEGRSVEEGDIEGDRQRAARDPVLLAGPQNKNQQKGGVQGNGLADPDVTTLGQWVFLQSV